jgi:Tfp pilus assembly protein PilW
MNRRRQRGFSTADVLIAMSIFTTIAGGVMTAVANSYRSYAKEHAGSDVLWQGRAAMDLMIRELRLAGYPAKNTFVFTAALLPSNSNLVAATFVTATSTQVAFEADVDGDGTVERVAYRINGTNLERSAVTKNTDGSVPAATYSVLASNVSNGSTPVFTYTTDPGSVLAAPGNTNSVNVHLILKSKVADPKNRQFAAYTFQGVAWRMNPDQ